MVRILLETQTMVLNIQVVFNYQKLGAYNLQGVLLKYSKTNSLPEDWGFVHTYPPPPPINLAL